MNITLKPSLAKFVKQQVKDGRYESVDHVMTAAVARLMQDDDLQFEPGELQALVDEGEKDFERGRFYTLEEVRREFTKGAAQATKSERADSKGDNSPTKKRREGGR
jgi:putative addiction module CopG family antidote